MMGQHGALARWGAATINSPSRYPPSPECPRRAPLTAASAIRASARWAPAPSRKPLRGFLRRKEGGAGVAKGCSRRPWGSRRRRS